MALAELGLIDEYEFVVHPRLYRSVSTWSSWARWSLARGRGYGM